MKEHDSCGRPPSVLLDEITARNEWVVRGLRSLDLKFSLLDTHLLKTKVLQEEVDHSYDGWAARSRSRKVTLWLSLPLRFMQAVSNTDLNGEASVHEATHAGNLQVTKTSVILILTSVQRTVRSRTIFKTLGGIFL